MRIRRITGKSIHLMALEALPVSSLLVDLGIVLALISIPLLPDMPLVLDVFLAGMYALYLGGAINQKLRAPRWLPSILMIIVVLAVLKYYRTLAGYEAGIALLTMLLGPKLLEIRKRRDFNTTITISLFLVVLQFLLNQSLFRALYMLPLVVAIFAILIQSNRVTPVSRREALILSLRLVAQAIPLMLVLFVLFPRLSAPLWALKLKSDRLVTKIGLADEMTPGSIDQLVHSDEVAFRAELQGSPLLDSDLYWRGPVFWHTDGLRWFGGPPQELLPAPLAQQGRRVDYRVILEPNGKKWVLALDIPGKAPRGTKIGADLQLRSERPIDQRTQFFLTSFLHYQTGFITPLERTAALQIPSYPPTNRLVTLVRSWQHQAQGEPKQVVELALEFFRRNNFVYTLNPPPLGSGRIETFLFETKAGFCEHYAGAFTLLMRIAGIPSRVVSGYLGGEYNELGSYYLVYQEYAHAWSEVWLPNLGWVRVDPTAAVAPERIQHAIMTDESILGSPISFRTEDFKGLRQFVWKLNMALDTVSTRWQMWILGYDTEQQLVIVKSLGLGFLDRIGIAIFMILFTISLGALLAWVFAHQGPPIPKDIPSKLYRRLCQKLARAGILHSNREGPQDFANRIARRRPDLANDTNALITMYIRIRYSPRPHPNDLRKFTQRLAAFHPRRIY